MAQTSFGFGLVITASMTASLLGAADDSNEAIFRNRGTLYAAMGN
jgi:hypothetical protein